MIAFPEIAVTETSSAMRSAAPLEIDALSADTRPLELVEGFLNEAQAVASLGFLRFFSLGTYKELLKEHGVSSQLIASLFKPYNELGLFTLNKAIRTYLIGLFINTRTFEQKRHEVGLLSKSFQNDCASAQLSDDALLIELAYSFYPFAEEQMGKLYQTFFICWKTNISPASSFRRAVNAFEDYHANGLIQNNEMAQFFIASKNVTPPWRARPENLAEMRSLEFLSADVRILIENERIQALLKCQRTEEAISVANINVRSAYENESRKLKIKSNLALARVLLRADRYEEVDKAISALKNIALSPEDDYELIAASLVEFDLMRYRNQLNLEPGRREFAEATVARAIEFYSANGFVSEKANALFKLVKFLVEIDDYKSAEAPLNEVISIYTVSGNSTGLTNALNQLVDIKLKLNVVSVSEVSGLLDESEKFAKESGSRSAQANVLFLRTEVSIRSHHITPENLVQIDAAISLLGGQSSGDLSGLINFSIRRLVILNALEMATELERGVDIVLSLLARARASSNDPSLWSDKEEQLKRFSGTNRPSV